MIPVENEHVVLAPLGLRPPGRRINYRVDLEALENDTLFFAGTPETLDLRARALYRYEASSFRLGHATPPGFHYDAFSLLDDPPETAPALFPPPVLPLASRELYLQLPTLDGRIAELARTFAAGATGDLARARSIERHLRSDYGYTLELPDREMADPLANFLFARRKGHCEYFASSMAVMLRSLGIPARLATGFQSGVYNPVSDLWLIRASDAHSWVEAWIPGYGWKTFDPTPADPNAGGLGLLTRLALYLDASETFWQEWVVTYDLVRQGTLAYRMEQGAQRLGIRWFDTAASLRAGWQRFGAGWSRRFGWQSLVWVAALVALGFAAGPLAPAAAHTAARGARPPRAGQRGRRHRALPAHAAHSEAARLPEAALVHAGGIRRIAAAHTARQLGRRVHRHLQRATLRRSRRGGAHPVDSAGPHGTPVKLAGYRRCAVRHFRHEGQQITVGIAKEGDPQIVIGHARRQRGFALEARRRARRECAAPPVYPRL